MSIPAFTDYPIMALGDKPGKEAPIRAVQIERCVRSSVPRCLLRVPGVKALVEVKCGYVYTAPGRCGEVPCVPLEDIEALPEEE